LGAALGPVTGDPLAEARAERERQMDEVQWGEPAT
jgi:hypothetical protein